LQLVGEIVVREYRIRCPKCRARHPIHVMDENDQNLYDFAQPQ